MGVFKNDVGRPTNKTIRIRFVIRIIFSLFGTTYYYRQPSRSSQYPTQSYSQEYNSPSSAEDYFGESDGEIINQ